MGQLNEHIERKRVQSQDGDWYVATPDNEWKAAMLRQEQAVHERNARMATWVAMRGSFDWEAYRIEKYRIPIEWALPVGHVIFR